MADDRRRRFSQIERPRGAGAEPPDASPGTDARFGALEQPAAPAAAPLPAAAPEDPGAPDPLGGPAGAPVARGHTDRFRPAAEQPLEVDERGQASQPFVRCARCETDSSRYAARCTTCGEPLDTDQQRAFNERLWAGRRALEEAEAGARAAREAALEQARLEASAARRTLAEGLAREVGERERRRLEGEGFGEPIFGPPDGGERWGEGRWGSPSGDPLGPRVPLGFRLLAALPPAWRVPAGVAAVALAAALFLVHATAGLVAGLALLSLFTPGRWRRRLRRW
jgi:hypothetical protein